MTIEDVIDRIAEKTELRQAFKRDPVGAMLEQGLDPDDLKALYEQLSAGSTEGFFRFVKQAAGEKTANKLREVLGTDQTFRIMYPGVSLSIREVHLLIRPGGPNGLYPGQPLPMEATVTWEHRTTPDTGLPSHVLVEIRGVDEQLVEKIECVPEFVDLRSGLMTVRFFPEFASPGRYQIFIQLRGYHSASNPFPIEVGAR